jgi:benzoate membrane transport protein
MNRDTSPVRLSDLSVSATVAGFIAVLVGFTSSVAVVFEAARGLGATPDQIGSWMWALCIGMGVGSLALSLWWKKPVMIAWSTPGAAVLATAAASGGFTLHQAVGAFLVCAALIILSGVTGWFEKVMDRIPMPIASALLAGVLARFGLDAFGALQTALVLVFAMLLTYLVGRLWWPRYVVPSVLLVGVALASVQGRLHFEGVALRWTTPVFVSPEWTWQAIVSLALPLFVVTMASQNLPGVAAIRHAGFDLPISKIITWTGVLTLVLAPFGAFALNLAAITAAIALGPEAHEDPKRRYMAAAACGFFYLIVGAFGATVTSVLGAFPRELILAVAGFALLGSIASGLTVAMADETRREAALLTFLVTLSGVKIFGIGSAFWGVVAGALALGVRHLRYRRAAAATIAFVTLLGLTAGSAAAASHASDDALAGTPPITYEVRSADPASHRLEIAAKVPTGGQEEIVLRWARWTPGFYKVEDYVGNVESVAARTPDGRTLAIERSSEPSAAHRWTIPTLGAPEILVSYRLRAESVSVTTNWAGPELLVLNPAAAFPTLADGLARAHEVHLVLPAAWSDAASSLATPPQEAAGERWFTASDYDQLVDSPIVAGRLERRTFDVDGQRFEWVDATPPANWNPERTIGELGRTIRENAVLWGDSPFVRYVFLNVFRKGRGGLEHRDSTLLTTDGDAVATVPGYRRWIAFVAHEFVHAYNVKRLRPVELGPFDYEKEPHTPSLWISEGLTTYVANLTLARAGAWTEEEFLDSQAHLIADLQRQPGRLRQTLEQSSLEVWNNSTSGVNPSAATVSYYTKGAVAGFVLDAHLRRLSEGRKTLDDLLRLAYARSAGARGFTPEEFRAAAREVAGRSLDDWFDAVTASTAEFDYRESLDWYGLRFAQLPSSDPADGWKLERDPAASAEQRGRFDALLRPSAAEPCH